MLTLSIPILLHKPDQKRNKAIQRYQNQNTLHPKIPIVEHPKNIFFSQWKSIPYISNDKIKICIIKHPPATQETWVWSLSWEDPLEKGMATYSSIPAWKIPWTEKPGRLRSMRLQRVNTTEVTSHIWLQ